MLQLRQYLQIALFLAYPIATYFSTHARLLGLFPLFIYTMLLWRFARTLLPQQEPLVTRFARVIYGDNTPEVTHYTRKVTWLWSVFFLAMLLESTSLTLYARPATASLFFNIFNYLFVAGMFLLEGIYRKIHFSQSDMFLPLIRFFWKQGMRRFTAAAWPLIGHTQLQTRFAIRQDRIFSCADFLNDVFYLHENLTLTGKVINLCEDRYHFTVLFACAILQRKISILPNNALPFTLQQLQTEFADSHIFRDADLATLLTKKHNKPDKLKISANSIPWIDADQAVAILYTSGSTGKPVAWQKCWGQLVTHAKVTANALDLQKNMPICVIATVASQHMYGFEHSIILPMQMGYTFYAGKPFFAADIQAALTLPQHEIILFSTPRHLKTCVDSQLIFSNTQYVISATAQLDKQLAIAIEETFAAPLQEIYGCTEVGGIATRRSAQDDRWKLMPDYQLMIANEDCYIQTPGDHKKIKLADKLARIDHHHFTLLGRHDENINIAGKRISLTDLNIKLTSIKGVEEGVFYLPENSIEDTRLSALVVAPNLSIQEIKCELEKMLDPVFLPRPLIKVSQLPRNEMGKITYALLKNIVALKKPALFSS